MFDVYDHCALGQGIWRGDFTVEQAHECAIACNVLHGHNERIRAILDAKRLADELEWAHEEAIKEDGARKDPEAFAAAELDKLHRVHVGDCDGESCECAGGTDCPHGWCEACVRAAVAERRSRGAKGPIEVRFGYCPEATATVQPDGTIGPIVDVEPD